GEGGDGADQVGIALDVEDCLPKLDVHLVHGLKRVVLEDFFADFIPEIFLRIEFRRIRRKVQQRDVVGNSKVAAAMLGYIVYAVGRGEGAVPFESWILRLLRGPIWWALFGAVIGGASIFVCILIRASFEGAQLRTPIVQSSTSTEHSSDDRP